MENNQCADFFKRVYNINNRDALEVLAKHSNIISIKKKTILNRLFNNDNYYYFFLFGILGCTHQKSDSRNIIDFIISEKGMIINYYIFDLSNTDVKYIALDDTEIVVVSKKIIHQLIKVESNLINTFYHYSKKSTTELMKLNYMRTLKSVDRVSFFLSNYTNEALKLTNTQIASFLDMNRQEFSRNLTICNRKSNIIR